MKSPQNLYSLFGCREEVDEPMELFRYIPQIKLETAYKTNGGLKITSIKQQQKP